MTYLDVLTPGFHVLQSNVMLTVHIYNPACTFPLNSYDLIAPRSLAETAFMAVVCRVVVQRISGGNAGSRASRMFTVYGAD